ncbi:MAG: 3-oxoacyl-ACP reductase FabG [Gemmatimonadota bacterium]|nr:MAG: 3-oxoacyl-ACP reductase FabG [Gemmatimonadota bacterium]
MDAGDLDDRDDMEGAPEGAGRAVEALLEELGEETQTQPAAHFGGLRGRTVVVSGGATGIGRQVAIEFARCGTNVAFTWVDLPDRSIAEEAAEVEQELQQLEVKVVAERVDVRDPRAVGAFIERVRQQLGGVHFLVNAAGIHRSAPLWKMTDEQWFDVLDVNLTGAFNMIRAVAPLLKSQRYGKVVNIASVHAFVGSFGVANYAASKSGLVGLTRSAAAELGPSNVNVNGVAPGYVRTGMLADVPDNVVADAIEGSALRRLPEPRDIAHVVLFLCSEMARQITGQVIRVDAGMCG